MFFNSCLIPHPSITAASSISFGTLDSSFTNNKKYAKKIKKTEKCVVYESAVRELFSCEQLIDSNDDSEKITGTL